MKRTRILALTCALLLLLSSGCGYQLAATQPTVMGARDVTLKIKGVEHPTLYPWLTHALRSNFRDEINARHIASWVDQGKADYEIQINVLSFTSREWMSSEEGVGMLVDTAISLEAIIYSSDSNTIIWKSRPTNYSDRTDTTIDRQDQVYVIKQAVQNIVDQIQTTF